MEQKGKRRKRPRYTEEDRIIEKDFGGVRARLWRDKWKSWCYELRKEACGFPFLSACGFRFLDEARESIEEILSAKRTLEKAGYDDPEGYVLCKRRDIIEKEAAL